MSTIFVQIASYRDHELPKTIEDCLANARSPERLRFGICWQHDGSELDGMKDYVARNVFRIDQVDYRESKGCGWARNRVNRLYNRESFTLQIDAHMRFAPYWDEILIDMIEATECERPVLTTYPPEFSKGRGGDHLHISAGIQSLILQRLNADLTTTLKCDLVPDRSKPGESKFIAAGFFFTLGRFCVDVPYDPEMYFNGEEINLSVRAFTSGYDFFYPNRNVIWHLYGHGAAKHWSDHPESTNELHLVAIDRLRELLVGDPRKLGQYGVGLVRTVADFEKFAGVDFAERVAQTEDRDARFSFSDSIQLPLSDIPDRDDYEFFVFCLLDGDDEEIYRSDIYDPEILAKRNDTIEIEAELDSEPIRYLLWPKSRHEGFESRLVIDL